MKSLGSLLRGAGVNGVCASFLTMTLGAIALGLALTGAGRFAADAYLWKK